jgi:hypothetical protein
LLLYVAYALRHLQGRVLDDELVGSDALSRLL